MTATTRSCRTRCSRRRYLFDGDGSRRTTYGPLPPARGPARGRASDFAQVLAATYRPTCRSGFTTTGAFGRFGGGLTYAQPGSGAASIGADVC